MYINTLGVYQKFTNIYTHTDTKFQKFFIELTLEDLTDLIQP